MITALRFVVHSHLFHVRRRKRIDPGALAGQQIVSCGIDLLPFESSRFAPTIGTSTSAPFALCFLLCELALQAAPGANRIVPLHIYRQHSTSKYFFKRHREQQCLNRSNEWLTTMKFGVLPRVPSSARYLRVHRPLLLLYTAMCFYRY